MSAKFIGLYTIRRNALSIGDRLAQWSSIRARNSRAPPRILSKV